MLLQCLQEYLETEEQWLFYLLAEKTGTTKVSIITLWHQHFPTIKTDFACDCIAKETRTIEQDFESHEDIILNLMKTHFEDIFPKI